MELYGRELAATDDTKRLEVEDMPEVFARQYGSGRYIPTVWRPMLTLVLVVVIVVVGCRLMEVAVRFCSPPRPPFSTLGELSGRICSSDLKRAGVEVAEEEEDEEEGAVVAEEEGGEGIQSALPRYGTEPVGTWADDR